MTSKKDTGNTPNQSLASPRHVSEGVYKGSSGQRGFASQGLQLTGELDSDLKIKLPRARWRHGVREGKL